MNKPIALSLILFVLFLNRVDSYTVSNPTWINSPYFCAGNNDIINSNTNGGQTRTQNIPFTVAFTGVPSIVYAIKTYKGTDQIWETDFAISKVTISQNNWRGEISLYGTSNMWRFGIQYLAVDPAFPYHLNMFDDVPFQYGSTLTNITTSSSALTTFTQEIDYSSQAVTKAFKAFTLPLTSNKIVLYISSLTMTADTSAPLKLDLSYSIINQTYYSWTANLFQYGTITNFRVCQIIYNEDNLQLSYQFVAIKYDWLTTGSSTSLVFESNFQKSMICGLTYFETASGSCGLDYDWDFVNDIGGSLESIRLRASDPSGNSTANCGQNLLKTTLFYIKTWSCPGVNVYFNLTTNLCQNACAEYYYANFTQKSCLPCYYACYNCTAAYLSNVCSQCEAGLQRQLVNSTCICSTGYFDDGFEPGCKACADVDPKSLSCTYAIDPLQPTSYYENIFNQTTWAIDILPNFTSITCVTAYFVNTSKLCQACPSYCITCTDSVTCTTCNTSSHAILYSDNLCYLCNLANCLSCYPDNICLSCSSPLVVSEGVCMTCVQACVCNGWVLPKINGTCSTLCGDGIKVGLEECDDGNLNDHDGCSSTCTLEPCNVSCLCDGWIQPWETSNSSCTTVCGDGLKRGIQECDDGNLLEHDGCSPTCTIQPCHISCLCDGWYPPWSTEMNRCQTICGDGYARGPQKCDDGNLIDGDGCDKLCRLQIPPLMTAKMSEYPSLILFALGFRIVGLEALNVLQNFQLICDATKIYTFKISFNIHGYNNSNVFPSPISSQGHLLTKFNFMYYFAAALFVVGIMMQIYLLCCCTNNKVSDSGKTTDKHEGLKQGSDDENHSDVFGDFTVHYKGQNKLKVDQSHIVHLDEQQQTASNHQYRILLKAIIITRQMFFHLIINLLSILIYSIVDQVSRLTIGSFLDARTLIVVISMGVFLALIAILFSIRPISFGQNLLKFNKGSVFEYWLLMIAQKVVFSAILGTKSFWNLQVILILKFFLLTYYCCSRLYFEHLQKVRSVVTHFLHFMLIFAVVLNEHIFKHYGLVESFPILFMESIYLGLVSLVLLIQFIFYVREFVHDCEADIREIDDSERVQAAQNGMIKAIFAVKNFETMEDSAQNLAIKNSNILQELKNKKVQRTSAFLQFPQDISRFQSTNKSSDTNLINSPPSSTSLSHLLAAHPKKKNNSHVRSQRGSNMMSVLQIQEERSSQIQEISVENQSSHKKKESSSSLQNGFTNQEIKVNFDKQKSSKEASNNQPHVVHAPKGFKNYASHLGLANKRRRLEQHKMLKTDQEPSVDESQFQSRQKLGPGFQTDNVINEQRKQSRQMTFHRSENNSEHQQEMKNNVEFHQIKVDPKPQDEHETVSINLQQSQ